MIEQRKLNGQTFEIFNENFSYKTYSIKITFV